MPPRCTAMTRAVGRETRTLHAQNEPSRSMDLAAGLSGTQPSAAFAAEGAAEGEMLRSLTKA